MDISEKITKKLVKMQVIDEEDKDLYVYGFQQGFILLINTITVILIGFVFNMVWQSIVFLVTYSVLRAYAGGYHASTQLRCYLFSTGMIILVLYTLSQIPRNGFICFGITTVSSIIIFMLAPVEDQNKPLSKLEQTVFKERTNCIMLILIGCIIIFWIFGFWEISVCMSVSLLVLSIMLVLGKAKNFVILKNYHKEDMQE